MNLISVSTNISEQQKTDTIEMLTDKDYSTINMNEQKNNKNLVIAESPAATNDISILHQYLTVRL